MTSQYDPQMLGVRRRYRINERTYFLDGCHLGWRIRPDSWYGHIVGCLIGHDGAGEKLAQFVADWDNLSISQIDNTFETLMRTNENLGLSYD